MLGIISDIHGNLEALQAVLAEGERQGVRTWYCLGDVVGYGASPNECTDIVRERCEVVILGNHDEVALGRGDVRLFNPLAAEAALWTRNALTESTRDFLQSLPLRHETDQATYVHGTPVEPARWRYIWDEVAAQAQSDGFGTRLCFVGHSHLPDVFRIDTDTERPTRLIVNVGSVGQPRDRDARGCMALLGDAGSRLELVRVGYDVDTAMGKIRDAGLPEALAQRLLLGR
jgi:diadenosine tetraphosphatase ApaH/serine/threonine PP2A family protein phosphatase